MFNPQNRVEVPKVCYFQRTTEAIQMVEKYPESIVVGSQVNIGVGTTTKLERPSRMCRELQKQKLTRKKRPYAVVSQLLKECKF